MAESNESEEVPAEVVEAAARLELMGSGFPIGGLSQYVVWDATARREVWRGDSENGAKWQATRWMNRGRGSNDVFVVMLVGYPRQVLRKREGPKGGIKWDRHQ